MQIKILVLILYCASFLSYCQEPASGSDSAKAWNVHYQFTMVDQYHPGFHALYSGLNSLQNTQESAMTITSTVFTGARLWNGASIFCNPEIAGGKGFSGATGVAGFPNGESFRVSNPAPTLTIARLFVRQRINLSTMKFDTLNDDANQVWEKVSETNLTLTAGKISLTDIFDDNKYSHDPRTQFLNWSLMDGGAWDFPADTRGYTYSFVLEYNLPILSFRGALSAEPTTANGPDLEFVWEKAVGYTFETEFRTSLMAGRPGTVRALLFKNYSHAGTYNLAIESDKNGTDTSLNVSTLSSYGGSKTGFNVGFDQEIASFLGAFLRISWNDGTSSAWAFTEIDQSLSLGINILGGLWKRKEDIIGLGLSINGISNEHRQFLNSGGYEFIIGDGKLTHYGTENILEAYYSCKLLTSLFVTADYQLIGNPAYNMDRGPVNVYSARVHVEF